MFPLIDAVVSLGGLLLPPVFDFVKKKFIKTENDTPERTLGNLATTKPEVLAPYTEALAKLNDSQVSFFNRDVVGTPSLWVVNLRASIRPIVVVVGLVMLITEQFYQLPIDSGSRLFLEAVVSSWMGSRLVK